MVTPSAPPVLPFPDARRVVEERAREARPTEIEPLPLPESRGRVLAENVLCDRDLPPFPRATRDGFAVRAADLATLPARLRVVGEIRAGGGTPPGFTSLAAGEAIEIMTGAAVPAGADAVVMVEYTARKGPMVEVTRTAAAGENVVPPGSEARAGDVIVALGTRLGYAQIGAAAAAGRTEVRVHSRPHVALLATGDEIVDMAAEPGPNQIRNSNSYSLAAQVEAAGGDPARLPIAPDEREALRRLIQQGLGADLLLITGGVSVGRYDLVEQVLGDFDAEIFFAGALIQPGRPVVFGRAARQPNARPTFFLGLPGNPISTMVTFELFARPLVDALSGAAPEPLHFLRARLKSEVKTKTGLTRFLPARLSGQLEETEVERVLWQGSGDLASAARANCFLVVPPDREQLAAGEMVAVLLR